MSPYVWVMVSRRALLLSPLAAWACQREASKGMTNAVQTSASDADRVSFPISGFDAGSLSMRAVRYDS